MSGIGLALAATSAFMQFKQAQAMESYYIGQAQALDVKAEWTRFDAKSESLKHKKQANDELEAVLIRLSQINSIAGAGNMDPYAGNPFGLKIRALNVGGTNYATAIGNETITRLAGEAQAKMFEHQAQLTRQAGSMAKRSGVMGALMTLAGGAFKYYQTSIPGGAHLQSTGNLLQAGGNTQYWNNSGSWYLGGQRGSLY